MTTTRTVNAGSFGSLSPGPFAGAVGSVGGAAAGARVERGAHRVQVDRAERAVDRRRARSASLTVREVALGGSMPGAHWSR